MTIVNKTRELFLFLISVTLVHGLIAQQSQMPAINQQEAYSFKSKLNSNSYQLFISLPKNYSVTDTTHFPVLFLLDANYSFPIAHATRQMLDINSEIQDIIIVGIGYAWEKSYQPWFATRWNDMTPTKDIKSDTNRMFLRIVNSQPGTLVSGGARRFVDIIKNEIMPFIDKKYRISKDRGISGHSLGGLFSTYCLLTEPGLFSRYGINSPSYWWDNSQMFEIEKDYAQKNKNLNARIFISVGGKEGQMMLPKMIAFADSLRSRKYSTMKLITYVFENETHSSVLPAAISRTLTELYKKEK